MSYMWNVKVKMNVTIIVFLNINEVSETNVKINEWYKNDIKWMNHIKNYKNKWIAYKYNV